MLKSIFSIFKSNKFKTSTGRYAPVKEAGVLKVKNIRYAFSKRYQKPTPVKEIRGRGIQHMGRTPACPQRISPLINRMLEPIDFNDYYVTETPQYLTITRPERVSRQDKLPVVVWIHGGSYEIGCGSIPTSNPAKWVKEQNIIVVAVSYRLGMFGFLGGYDERKANLGIFDILEAVRWVKKNISSFGGDSENITLLGQSSGADAVAHLLTLEEAKRLFHKVIIHSPPMGLRKGRASMSEYYSGATSSVKNSRQYPPMIKTQKEVAPSPKKYGLKALMPFGVQYGFPPFAPEDEIDDCWKAHAKDFDILIGYDADETAFYLKTWKSWAPLKKYRLTKALLNRMVRYTTSIIYAKSIKDYANMLAQAGGNVYSFKIKLPSGVGQYGAAHCIDLPLLFSDKKAWQNSDLLKGIPWSYLDKNGKEIRQKWADFMRYGKINCSENLPEMLEIEKVEA